MSIYSFKITKGKFQLTLSTTDKEMVSDQFALWVRKSAEYSQKRVVKECKDKVEAEILSEKEVTQKRIDEQINKKDSRKNNIDEIPSKQLEQAEKVSKEQNLDIFYAPPKQDVRQTVDEQVASAGFDNILENSMQTPQSELSFKPNPTIKKDNAFLNYIGSRAITKKMDYLLLTAYYFTQYEQKPRFTLKQLNAKLMQNLAVILDHSVLQEAINNDYIECLPDLTGLVGVSEYRLTAYGEKVLLNV